MKPTNFFHVVRVVLLTCLTAGAAARADELQLKVTPKEPPAAVAKAIAAELSCEAVQLLDGESPAFEFWFRSTLPLKSAPATPARALKSLKEATLLGVVSIPKDRRDYRDDELYSGVHTIRFALQPQDGNHLGTADFDTFAVLVPAERDATLAGIRDYDGLVDASSEDTASEHPIIMSLRPPDALDGPFPSIHEPKPEHKSIRIKLAGQTQAGESADVVFELVYEGVGEL